MPAEEAAPADVEDGERRRSPFARASATGRQSAVSSSIAWPGSSVHSRRRARRDARGDPLRRGSPARPGRAAATPSGTLGVDPRSIREAAAVLDHASRVVGGEDAEVQRLVRALADAADARRERDLVRAGRLPADHAASISSRAAASSDSRPSSSPFSLRRRSSASTSPTCGDSPRPSSARSAPVISSRTSRSRSK